MDIVKPNTFPLYGFVHAPCSKSLLLVTGISTIGAKFLPQQYRQLLSLNWNQVTHHKEIWRLFTGPIFYDSAVDLMYGSIMLYYFRLLERRWGSRNYASFLVAVSSMTAAIHFTLYYLRGNLPFNVSPRVVSGLYGPLFSALVYYIRDIPSGYVGAQLPIPVSNKILLFLMALKLLTGSKPISDICIVGLVSGVLYRVNFLWVQQWFRIPSWCTNTVAWCYAYIDGNQTTRGQSVIMGATEETQEDMIFYHIWESQSTMFQGTRAGRQRIGQGYSDILQPPSTLFRDLFGATERNTSVNYERPEEVAVPEEKIQKLVEMGFAREAVVDALSSTNSDVQEATSLLLSR